jgi:hypothetical protein
MANLTQVNLGTIGDGSDGDALRTAMQKINTDIAILMQQATLTSAVTITATQNLTAALHQGKRVVMNFGTTGAVGMPLSSTCAADGIILLMNRGTTNIPVVAQNPDTVDIPTLYPGESAFMGTDGAGHWNCLLRGRSSNSANEVVSGNSTVVGNETVGGTLSVAGIVSFGSTGQVSISALGAYSGTSAGYSSNVTVGGTLGVTGASTLAGVANLNGGATIRSSLVVFKPDNVSSAATMDSNGNIGGTGLGTFNSLSIGTTATILGATSIGGTLGVAGTLNANGSILLKGGLTLYQADGVTAAVTLSATGAVGSIGPIQGTTVTGTTRGVFGGAAISTGGSVSATGTYPFYTRDANATAGQFWAFGGDASSSFAIRAGGGDGTGAYLAYNGTTWAATSDRRLKKNMVPLTNALDSVKSLSTIKYKWRSKRRGTGTYVGFIAQDVQAVLPECVTTDKDGYLGVQYAELTVLLAAAVKELADEKDAEINQLRTQMAALQASVNALLARGN